MSKRRIRYLTLTDLEPLSTISVEEAAYLLGISRQAAYNAVHRGDIPHLQIGERFLVLAQPLRALLIGAPVAQE